MRELRLRAIDDMRWIESEGAENTSRRTAVCDTRHSNAMASPAPSSTSRPPLPAISARRLCDIYLSHSNRSNRSISIIWACSLSLSLNHRTI